MYVVCSEIKVEHLENPIHGKCLRGVTYNICYEKGYHRYHRLDLITVSIIWL